jgi:hypothetical protein
MAEPSPNIAEPPLRPGDFARMLLAAAGDPPRARARDQQADLVGEAIRRVVLNRLVVLDPDPEALESALVAIVADLGEPSGSTRAVCTAILQEWEMVRLSPGFWPFLIGQAMGAEDSGARSRKKRGASG